MKGKEWLANNEFSIADIAAFPWVYSHSWAGEQAGNAGDNAS